MMIILVAEEEPLEITELPREKLKTVGICINTCISKYDAIGMELETTAVFGAPLWRNW
jgi:hypothetical protein